jgi:hypothetical protein
LGRPNVGDVRGQGVQKSIQLLELPIEISDLTREIE